MDLRKQILLLAICVSFTNAIISMENNKFDGKNDIKRKLAPYTTQRINPNDLIEQADNLVAFVKDHEQNEIHMLRLGMWLTNQRNKFTDNEAWSSLIGQLRKKMYSRVNKNCDSAQAQKALLVMTATFRIAKNLQPNQECLTQFIQEAINAIKDAEKWLPAAKDLMSVYSALQKTNNNI